MNTFSFPRLCGSVAGKPSQLGVKMHNAAYRAAGLDYTYIAFGTTDLPSIVQVIRAANFRGLAVSMPFKQDIIGLLNKPTEEVRTIGACNTVVQEDGVLTGYNTDWRGAITALKEQMALTPGMVATIVGAGGVARAIAYGLREAGVSVFVSARSLAQRSKLVNDLGLAGHMDIEGQGIENATIIVNATPVSDLKDSPVKLTAHKNARVLLDVGFQKKETPLVSRAAELGWLVAPGWRMLLFQAVAQFELYTSTSAPTEVMEKVLSDALG